MKRFTKLLFQFNEYLFYFIYSLSLLFTLLEAFSYKGFIQKHFVIPLDLLILITLISGTFILFSNHRNVFFDFIKRIYYKTHLILTPLIFLFWLTVTLIESFTYDNYIFTKLHVTPEYILPVVFLTIFFTTATTVKQATASKKFNTRQKLSFLIIYIFFLIFIYQNQQTVPYAIQELKWLFKNPTATYEEKIGFRWGDKFYAYVKFIRETVPSNSKVLIPPREDPWGIEGNDHVMRAFVYPRKVVRYQKSLNVKKEDFDYVLISGGFYSGYKQFPQFNLNAKEIILFDIDKKTKRVVDSDIYDYQDKIYEGKYGLIKLK